MSLKRIGFEFIDGGKPVPLRRIGGFTDILIETCAVNAQNGNLPDRSRSQRIRQLMDTSARPILESTAPIQNCVAPAPAGLDCQRVEELIGQARAGSTEALGELLTTCRKYLTNLANREISGPLKVKVAVSDLVQDTALDALRGFAHFRGQRLDELLAWLRTVLLHNVASAGRRYQGAGKRDLAREVPLGAPGVAGNLRDAALSPRSLATAVEEQTRIERAIDRLPADQRSAILMRHRDHQSFVEIGAALGRSMPAAHKLWCRAVLRLQRELTSTDDQE